MGPGLPRMWVGQLRSQIHIVGVIAVRDLKLRYYQSVLGPAWLIFQPLALLAALLVAFDRDSHAPINHVSYVLFALVGMCVWSFFQSSVVTGTSCLLSNETLVRRSACPRIAFPLASVATALPILCIVLAPSLAMAIVEGRLSLRVLFTPLAILWLIGLTSGTVWLVSAVAVYLRDVVAALPLLVQAGAFISPVGYATSSLSPAVRTLVDLNPLTGLIEVWRWVLIGGTALDPLAVTVSFIGTVLALAVGWDVFRRFEPTMADVI